MDDFTAAVQAFRQQRYRQTPDRKLNSLDEVIAFFNEVGFCLFYRHPSIEVPNLRDATAGEPGEAEGRNWGWKDELFPMKVVYYGKVYRRKPGFVALDILPSLYTLSAAADVGGDLNELVLTGTLSGDARRLTEVVMEKGPLSTHNLKKESGFSSAKSRFNRIVEEAQEKMLITMVRATSGGRADYSYIWDTFARAWPEVISASEKLKLSESRANIVKRYIHTAGAATAAEIARIFSLEADPLEKAAKTLVEKGEIKTVTRGNAVYYVCNDLV
jgi:hypothetical protein